jgi:lipoprotein-anchoring transpeptidase ErfK/SrfK
MSGTNDIPQRGRWIIVDLPAHVIHVYEGGKEVRKIFHFSVGRTHHQTPLYNDATILPHKRYLKHSSSIYHAPMPYSLFFDESRAFHGGSVNVESHGCVHLNETDAPWLFHWAGKHEVHVRFIGPYSHKHVSADPVQDWKYA